MKNLAHSASFDSDDKNAPSKPGIKHLGEGNLEASAIDQGGRVSQIPACEWSYLQLASRAKGTDFLVFSHQNTVAVYDGITIPRGAIFAHWPAAVDAQPAEPTVGVVPTLPRRDRKLSATLQAIAGLYGGVIPSSLSAKALRYALNDWLRANGHEPVSATTLRRALKEFAAPIPPIRAKSTMGELAL